MLATESSRALLCYRAPGVHFPLRASAQTAATLVGAMGGGPMNILPASKAAKQFALPAVFLFPIIIAPLAVRAVSVAVDSHAAHRAAPNHPVLARNQQLAFERNEGQTNREVQFVSRTPNYTIFLQSHKATIAFRGTSLAKGADIKQPVSLCLLQSNHTSAPLAEEPLPAKRNYFIGSDPRKWRTNVCVFGKVRYPSVYQNVDLVYYGSRERLEYDFIIRPGGQPQSIIFSVAGAKRAEIEQSGDLALQAGDAHARLHRPFAYQIINAQRYEVSARFLPLGSGRFGIEVSSYDRKWPLIIDPVLDYSSYLGGSNDEGIFGIGFDGEGNLYVAGETSSLDFPEENGAQTHAAGSYDAFVSKFDPSGTRLIYSTYLGGSRFDDAIGIQVNEAGSVYIAGLAQSADFPAVNARQPAFGGGPTDGFVAKLSPSGSELEFSTYLGGRGYDYVKALAIDHEDRVYVAGYTNSLDFPITSNAFQKECDQGAYIGFCIGDAFVAKLDSSGQNLVYSTYLGGSSFEAAAGLAVDQHGQAYVAGQAASRNFPTRNPYQASLSGPGDAFVTKLNAAGSDIEFSTFLGGGGTDAATDIALDPPRHVYVTGRTASTDFPIVRAFQSENRGGVSDGFVAKFDSKASNLIYSTYVGGSAWDYPYRIAVRANQEASVIGFTSSPDFPTHDALNSFYGGGATDAFLVTLDRRGENARLSTYLGGSGADYGYAITIGSGNSIWFGGSTTSMDFPLVRASQDAYAGGPFDAFLGRILLKHEQD